MNGEWRILRNPEDIDDGAPLTRKFVAHSFHLRSLQEALTDPEAQKRALEELAQTFSLRFISEPSNSFQASHSTTLLNGILAANRPPVVWPDSVINMTTQFGGAVAEEGSCGVGEVGESV